MTEQMQQNQETTKPGPTVEALLIAIGKRLARMDDALQAILETFKAGPDFQRTLEEYPTFDWSKIGATVRAKDAYGATVVEWNGKLWKRRAPDNKYGVDVWFSRCVGKEDNENVYAVLINFREKKDDNLTVEPLGSKAKEALGRLRRPTAA